MYSLHSDETESDQKQTQKSKAILLSIENKKVKAEFKNDNIK